MSFATPLLGTLPGKVFFGDGFKLYVVVDGSGVHVALPGDVRLDPATGQITTVFDDLPQVPFSSFALTFRGGPNAVLANPTSCGTKTVSALLTPWSGTPAKAATGTFAIDAGCGPPALAPGAAGRGDVDRRRAAPPARSRSPSRAPTARRTSRRSPRGCRRVWPGA